MTGWSLPDVWGIRWQRWTNSYRHHDTRTCQWVTGTRECTRCNRNDSHLLTSTQTYALIQGQPSCSSISIVADSDGRGWKVRDDGKRSKMKDQVEHRMTGCCLRVAVNERYAPPTERMRNTGRWNATRRGRYTRLHNDISLILSFIMDSISNCYRISFRVIVDNGKRPEGDMKHSQQLIPRMTCTSSWLLVMQS